MAELSVARSPRVLFFVEGNTDIRFVVGLSEICDLTMAVPARAYEESGLKARVAASGARVQVHEIAGGRAAFQWRSLAYLWQAVPGFDVVLGQEMLRGSLNATVVPTGFLGYLTVWPTGLSQPFVSTLNAYDGQVTANALIVPAGTGGAASAFASHTTHLILDIGGYFAP